MAQQGGAQPVKSTSDSRTFSPLVAEHKQPEVSDEELVRVMADFLAMGHVENIVAMFRQEERYFDWVDHFLEDERFSVRLGTAVLFEYLLADGSDAATPALPALERALHHAQPWVRGEAVNILRMLGTVKALELVADVKQDPDAQVREIAADILGNNENG